MDNYANPAFSTLNERLGHKTVCRTPNIINMRIISHETVLHVRLEMNDSVYINATAAAGSQA